MPQSTDDSRDSPDARGVAARLTRAALALLDLTFEPASVCTGERFDLLMESLSDQLSEAGSALLACRPAPAFVPPSLPAVPYAEARRAQAMLRTHVENGHLPGNGRSIAACIDGLRDVRDDLRTTSTLAPSHVQPFVADLLAALARLLRVLEAYLHSFERLGGIVAEPGAARAHAADSVTRAERALLRCLDRCGDDRVLR